MNMRMMFAPSLDRALFKDKSVCGEFFSCLYRKVAQLLVNGPSDCCTSQKPKVECQCSKPSCLCKDPTIRTALCNNLVSFAFADT